MNTVLVNSNKKGSSSPFDKALALKLRTRTLRVSSEKLVKEARELPKNSPPADS